MSMKIFLKCSFLEPSLLLHISFLHVPVRFLCISVFYFPLCFLPPFPFKPSSTTQDSFQLFVLQSSSEVTHFTLTNMQVISKPYVQSQYRSLICKPDGHFPLSTNIFSPPLNFLTDDHSILHQLFKRAKSKIIFFLHLPLTNLFYFFFHSGVTFYCYSRTYSHMFTVHSLPRSFSLPNLVYLLYNLSCILPYQFDFILHKLTD